MLSPSDKFVCVVIVFGLVAVGCEGYIALIRHLHLLAV